MSRGKTSLLFVADGVSSQPPYLHNAPRGLEGLIFFSQLCPFTCRRICARVPNCFTFGPAVWHISNIFEFVTPKPLQMPLGARGVNYFSLFPFPDESVYVCQVRSQSVQGFGSFPRFMN